MEKNIPGLKKLYNSHLARLRASNLTAETAKNELAIWSARYHEYVTDSEDGIYGSILDAYARREALKQYIEELKGGEHNDRI